jgi:hypothetical protein
MICILSGYERQNWPCKDLADFLINLRFNNDYAWYHSFAHNFIPAASARNKMADALKDLDADWILMIDNDMAPPANLLDTIKNAPADAGVVVPKFFLWDQTARSVRLCWGIDNLPRTPNGDIVIEDKYYELNKCGTGAIFIRPEVFRTVTPPWFFYTYDAMQGMTATEDINFAQKVIAHGIKVYGYGGITVGHNHTVDLSVVAKMLYDFKNKTESPSVGSVADGESLPTSQPNQDETACPAGEISSVQ